ncbi:alcohol dehydrogenase catalytic domain-containing protein [Erythrobacter sp.]|uniref:alcohol dehydrogenase catalytic domain-containing protein n=1 Tax=Erythrobacter sp. TaxID=1042 RepID=UPI003C768C50
MKRMIFIEPGWLEWEDCRAPEIQADEQAIVRPLVMGRCDLDTLYVNGLMPLASGEPIGHEIIGEIVDLGGEAARSFSIGERVMVAAQISCGACRRCLANQTGRCEKVPFGASFGMGREGSYGGGVSERVRVPFANAMLRKVPRNAELTSMIGLVDMAADAWRAVGPQLSRMPGGTVLVVGAAVPVISIYAAGLAVALGASRTVYVDPDRERRQIAVDYGAEAVASLEEVSDPPFDIIVDAAMNAGHLAKAFELCGPAAQMTSIAPPFVSPELPLVAAYGKGLDWSIGRPNCAFGQRHAVESWACCGFDPQKVGPKLFEFDEAPEAWVSQSLYAAVVATDV